MNGEDSARCGLAGLEKECVRLSHQAMLGGYQIETSFTASVSDRFQVKVNKCSSAIILITHGARQAQQ